MSNKSTRLVFKSKIFPAVFNMDGTFQKEYEYKDNKFTSVLI